MKPSRKSTKKVSFNADFRKSNADIRRLFYCKICDHLRAPNEVILRGNSSGSRSDTKIVTTFGTICENLRSRKIIIQKSFQGLFKFGILFLLITIFGCASYEPGKFRGDFPIKESAWIKEGQPIIFENQSWYPTEDIENLLDSEMDLLGQYNEVPFYIERSQIKPFNRVYTKFGNHQYRLFKQR